MLILLLQPHIHRVQIKLPDAVMFEPDVTLDASEPLPA